MNSPPHSDDVSDAPDEEPPGQVRSRGWRTLQWVSVVLSVVLVAVSVGIYLTVQRLDGQIDRENVKHLVGTQPPKLNNA